ncbi:MAG: hypothetical protein JSW33_16295 [bacterium]|nr:MAG: hypothetical protein JSW33_16295 [bacterium]
MDTIQIEYQMSFPDNNKAVYVLQFESRTMKLLNPVPDKLPQWTDLSFQQCSHCPLSSETHPHCPLAVRLVDVIQQFDHLMSYENLILQVKTLRRVIFKKTTVQDALSALMGLIIPSSGCPHTAYFRPMARFHLPLADTEETIYRSTSMYLLAQYFRNKAGLKADPDLTGLKKIYEQMQTLNSAIAERLRSGSKTDSSVNALILLDMFTLALPFAIEESLEELRDLFAKFLSP